MITKSTGKKASTISPAITFVENIATIAEMIEKNEITTLDNTVRKLLKVIVSFVTLETIDPAGVWSK